MRELVGGKNTIGRTAAVLKKPHKATFNLYALGIDSASNRNKYQVYFLGVKVAGA